MAYKCTKCGQVYRINVLPPGWGCPVQTDAAYHGTQHLVLCDDQGRVVQMQSRAIPYLCVGCGKVYPNGPPSDGCKCGATKPEDQAIASLPNAWNQTPPEPKEETWRDRAPLL